MIQTITVDDETAPTLTGTAYAGTSGTNVCQANAVTTVPFDATKAIQGYTDNCSGTVTAVLTNTSVTGSDCSWTVTYTFSVSDACGNTLTDQSYSNTGGNTIPPSISTCPAPQIFCQSTDNMYTIPILVATSNCGPAPLVSYSITGATNRSGNSNDASGTFAIGVSTISWTATDACGLTATCSTTVTVYQTPTVNVPDNQALCNNTATATVSFTGAVAGTVYNWTNNNTSIGLGASGSGDIGSFIVTNTGATTQVATITVTPYNNGCPGASQSFTITVYPTPPTPVVAVGDNCGSSILFTSASGNLLWSTGETTSSIVVTSPGTYTVTATVNGCASAAGSGIAAPKALPATPTFTITQPTCTVPSGTISINTPTGSGLTYSIDGVNYQTGTLFTGLASNSYYVTVKDASSGCVSLQALAVVNAQPVLPAAPTGASPQTFCSGKTVNDLVASGLGIQWYAASSGGSALAGSTVLVDGIHYFASQTVGSCESIDRLNVLVRITPAANPGTISGLTGVCVGSNITLSSNGDIGGSWSSGTPSVATVDASGNVYGVSAGTVIIKYTVTNTCGSNYATYSVTVSANPNAGSISGATTVCVGSTINLSSSGTAGGLWTSSTPGNATVTQSGMVTGVASGYTTITYSVTNACGTATSANFMVFVNPVASAGTITGSNSVCVGNSILLSDIGGDPNGTWLNGSPYTSITSLGSSVFVTGLSAGTSTIYYLVLNSGCTASMQFFQVTVSAGANAGTLSGPGSVCAGSSVQLSSSVSGGSWSSGSGTATVDQNGNVTGVSVGTATIYYTVTNGCGTATTSTTVSVTGVPTVAAIANGSSNVCVGATTAAFTDATGSGTWSITNGTGSASISPTGVVTGLTAGTVTVNYTVTNGCGPTTVSTSLTVNDLPTAGITNNTGVTVLNCTTTSINVTATGGASYSWNGGATPNSATNSFTAPGTYTVTVTGAGGCTSTASILITQDVTPPTAAISNNTGTTVLTCATQTISVTATGGVSYSWSGGLGNNADASITSAGTYTVTVTGANGCTNTASITVTQNVTPPVAAITNNSNTTALTCATQSISVTATGGVSYAWSGGLGNNAGATITQPGTYTVTVTGSNGCTATASIDITQDLTQPTVAINNITGTTVLTCSTTSVSVTATGGVSYSWNGGSSASTATNSFNAAGTYTVTVTGANGCTNTSSIQITQDVTVPAAGITNNTGVTVLNCTTTSINVTATGGVSYSWNGGATPNSATNSFTAPGTYTVTVTGAGGCTSTASITDHTGCNAANSSDQQ